MKMRLPLPLPTPIPTPALKKNLYITIASLILLTFVLIIARIADKGTPSTRTNTWGIAVCIKAALFLLYQTLTTYHHKLRKWASLKANMTLDIIDTVFWFVLFVISIMGAVGGRSASSQALGAVVAGLALVLCGIVGFLSVVCVREYSVWKRGGNANVDVEAGVEGDYKAGDTV